MNRHVASSPRRASLAAVVGTTVEWYDFFIYATAAALVFRDVFFPEDMNPVLGTVAAFGTTSFGYLGRPIGAMVFGSIGDRFGRKKALIVSLVLMGVATLTIGLLPGYATLGAFAPLLLIVCRLVQGFAVGGEWGGAALISVEHAPPGRKTFYGSFTQLGSSLGALLSAAAFAVSDQIGDGLTGGSWRYPFLLAGVLIVIGLAVRLSVPESPQFAALAEADNVAEVPVREVISTYRGRLLLGAGTMLVATGGYYVTSSFLLMYATEEGSASVSLMLNALTVGAVFEIVFMPLAGWLGDRFSPHRVVVVGLLGIAVLAPFMFAIARGGSATGIYVSVAVVAFFTACNYAPMAHILSDLFPVRVRYTGAALAYAGAALTAGALTPIVLPSLLAAAHGSAAYALGYLALLCVIATACVLGVRRYWDGAAAARAIPGDGAIAPV